MTAKEAKELTEKRIEEMLPQTDESLKWFFKKVDEAISNGVMSLTFKAELFNTFQFTRLESLGYSFRGSGEFLKISWSNPNGE